MINSPLYGFVTVRTSSTRLPQKCLLPFGSGNVLEHVICRARHFGLTPVVCTSMDASDDIIEKIAAVEGVACFRGSLNNKLKRWADCAAQFGIKTFHTIDADDPFFDGDEMKASLMLMQSKKLDMVCPSQASSGGGGSVGYSLTADIVARALRSLPEDADTEMMWYYIEKVEGLESAVLANNPMTPPNLRLTLDYEEDYWLLESVRKMVGNLAPRRDIDNLFARNPDLHRVNWFRNTEWKSAQLAKKF